MWRKNASFLCLFAQHAELTIHGLHHYQLSCRCWCAAAALSSISRSCIQCCAKIPIDRRNDMAFRKKAHRTPTNEPNDEQTNKPANQPTNEWMNKWKKGHKQRNARRVCVWARACKYDTKFYLISLPRDTTPKFIHRWFIHTISSLAFNRIPLSTRRIFAR